MLKKVTGFFKEVNEEMKKVSWPPKEEVVNSSVIVIVFIVFLSLILGFVDLVASTVIGLLLR